MTQYNFCFDATKKYAPDGPTKIRAEVMLNPSGTQFTADNTLKFRYKWQGGIRRESEPARAGE